MRFVSTDFNALLQSSSFSLATCVKIVQRNGTTKYFTDWSADLTVDSQVYRSDVGVHYYTLESNAGFDTGSFAIEGLISAQSYSAKELQAQVGFLSNARVEVFQVNPADLTDGVWPLKYGFVSRVLPKDLFFSLECETLDAKLSRTPIVETYQIDCRFAFGDANCTITPTTQAGVITQLTDEFTFVASAFAGPGTAGYYSHGRIEFAELPNFPNKIKSYTHATKTFVLMLPMPLIASLPTVSGAFTAFQGCDLRFRTCKNTYANVANFGGFPHIPGPRVRGPGGFGRFGGTP